MRPGRRVQTYLMKPVGIKPCGTWSIVRPKDDNGLADNILYRNRPPISTVLRVVAIVTHYKQLASRNAQRRNVFLPGPAPIGMQHRIILWHAQTVHIQHSAMDLD